VKPALVRAQSRDETQSSSIAKSMDALDQLLIKDLQSPEDPFAPMPAHETRKVVEKSDKVEHAQSGSQSNASGYGGKRQARSELEEFLDVRLRFAGLTALVKGLSSKGALRSCDIAPGQTVVLSSDGRENLSLFMYQAYELTAIYYQQPGEFTTRMQVNSLDAPPPSQDKNWEMWVELFSEEYHSGPVRCLRSEVDFRTVFEEVFESLKIAVPVMIFWGSVCYSFVTLADTHNP